MKIVAVGGAFVSFEGVTVLSGVQARAGTRDFREYTKAEGLDPACAR